MPDNKKTPVEEAMEKKCILLVAGKMLLQSLIAEGQGLNEVDKMEVNCLGPICAQYATFANVCGWIK